MDLDNTLRTLCPDAHGRVLGVLAHADEPLTASRIVTPRQENHIP